MDRTSLETLRITYEEFKVVHESAKPGQPLPVNHGDKRHKLDCQVINHLHEAIEQAGARGVAIAPYDTVRGLYQEDDPVFPGSMIMERTHIQIAVLTPEISIQGYFRVPEAQYR